MELFIAISCFFLGRSNIAVSEGLRHMVKSSLGVRTTTTCRQKCEDKKKEEVSEVRRGRTTTRLTPLVAFSAHFTAISHYRQALTLARQIKESVSIRRR